MATKASKYGPVAAASIDARRVERQMVTITRATARRRAREPRQAALHDISIYGCHVVTGERHAADERLWLGIAGAAPIAATVVWSDGGAAGCRFDAPIANALVRAMTLYAG